MANKLLTTAVLFFFLILAIFGLWALTAYYDDLPNRVSQHETMVLGQNRFVPGSQAAIRVVVRDSKDAAPLANAEINVSLRAEGGKTLALYTGSTDAQGTANVSFQVPNDAAEQGTLIVETKSKLGADTVERPVTLARDYRILLTTDKPLYQPGQVIHVRALALSTFDLSPAAGQELEVIIADGKGNKVFRKRLTTSEFGAAWTDFQLASEVNTGPYKITAVLGNTSSEKTVTVEHYVLPKFAVELETERPYYQPGEHVAGSLQSDYFFGKPVAGGQVLLEGYTFDVQRNLVFSLQGATDDSGRYAFEFDLPGYIAGSDLEGGLGRFYLQASITDLAQHTESSNLSLPVAQNALVIEAIPEGGRFRTGVENILYVLTSYPDGAPAPAELTLNFWDGTQPIQVQTGEYGLAEVRMTPQNPYQQIGIEAYDTQGRSAYRDFYFEGEWSEESVLLRPERPVYQVGETLNLLVFTSNPQGTVYLDIVRDGQTVSTRSVDVSGGKGQVAVDLTPDLFGTIEVHAYKILRSGSIARDTRLVVVDQATSLDLSLGPACAEPGADGCVFRPGETAGIDVQVNDPSGGGARAALGLAIVDESVFALAEQDPGFAKLYFMLEAELLQPRFDLHGFSVPDLLPSQADPQPRDAELLGAIENTARASLAAAAPQMVSFSLQANSHEDAMQRAYTRQEKYFTGLSKGLYGVILVLPLAVLVLSGLAVWREKRLSQTLAVAFGLALLLVLLFFLWPLGEAYSWVSTPMDRLSVIMDQFRYGDDTILVILLLVGLGGFLGLAVFALRRKDRNLAAALILLPLFIVVLTFLGFASTRANVNPSDKVFLAGLLAFLMLPVAFVLRFASWVAGRQAAPAIAALCLVVLLLLGTLPVVGQAAYTMSSGGMLMNQNFAGAEMMRAADGAVFKGMPAMPMEMPAAMAPLPTQAAAMESKPGEADSAQSTGSAAEPPRLRQYFPETMLWLPDAVTGEDGHLRLDIPVADSITIWRMTALASTQDGRLGSATAGLRVFQDFFIDLDLPLALTVGDEVAVPVGVFNYLPEAQDVRLELEQASWFELLDEPVKEISIASNDISVVYFRVRALQFGRQPFKVTALGSQMSDAILKEVRVFPDGKQIRFSQADRLNPGMPVSQAVKIPTEAIPGTQSLLVKVYPGILSQVVEGLDSILRMPNGCFEQTSSTTYPNVLVLDYLKTTNQASPETQMKAEEYINLGYQRLATFEVGSSGGFSLFGDVPADRMLTAYGLQEFADMSRVHDVDPALVQRAAEWLMGQQTGDGSWENDRGLVHESTWSSLGNDRLPVTAYIVWSLVDAGFGDDPRTQQGLAYMRENQAQAEDPYVVALVANALVAADVQSGGKPGSATEAVLERLAGMATMEGNGAYWKSGVATFMGAEGQTGSIETTALAALAFLRAGSQPELGNAALTYLVQQKDSFGTWHSTQATVLALKALIQSVRAGGERVNASVQVSLNGGQTRTLQVTPENFDVVQLVSFDDVLPGKENQVTIQVEGEGNLMYQVAGSYYLPWDKLGLYPELVEANELVTIDVSYDRTELAVNDTVNVNVTIKLNKPGGRAESGLIDLGLPPGFTLQAEDLEALVNRYNDLPADYPGAKIQRFELTGRQILVYITNLSADEPLQFSYRLRAKFPLVAQTPASNAYDYYNPEVAGEIAPQTLVVKP